MVTKDIREVVSIENFMIIMKEDAEIKKRLV